MTTMTWEDAKDVSECWRRIDALEADNRRLREALQQIADMDDCRNIYEARGHARAALEDKP